MHLSREARRGACAVATWLGALRRQAVAGQVFHRQVRTPVVAADVVDADDVPVHQPRGGSGLAHEARGGLGVLRVAVGQQLERDLAAQRFLQGEVHRRHAALAEHADDAVAGDAVGKAVHGPEHTRPRARGPHSRPVLT